MYSSELFNADGRCVLELENRKKGLPIHIVSAYIMYVWEYVVLESYQ